MVIEVFISSSRKKALRSITRWSTGSTHNSLQKPVKFNARIRHEFIEKGKPHQNGFSKSFNARFQDESLRILDLDLMPLKEIKQAIYDCIKEYNCQRPHSGMPYETPIRFHILSYSFASDYSL